MPNQRKIDLIKKGKPFSLLDIIAITLSLVLALTYIVVSCAVRDEGDLAVKITLTKTGQVYTYPLDTDREINLVLAGDKHIDIIINNGWVYVKHSDCHNKICERMSKKRYSGEYILCQPLGVYIEIQGRGLNPSVG